ncbi:hypothetical protein BV917_04860 [Leptospira santarosai serovar Guaricura]|nr:hypothetical protein BV917_04880 [Leptospira santarosai serovar Guaricura]OLY61529.1 hypothetical protein BV917_04860 [Leptospira santarosai serovar Guaricura]
MNGCLAVFNLWCGPFVGFTQKLDTFLVITSQKIRIFRNAVATIGLIFFIVEMKLLKDPSYIL